MANNENSTKGKKAGILAIGAGIGLALIGVIKFATSKKAEAEEEVNTYTEDEIEDCKVEVEDSEEE